MKTRLLILAVLFTLAMMPLTVQAKKMDDDAIKAKVEAMTTEQRQLEANRIQERVNQVRAMDLSTMSAEERKNVREEMKGLKKEAKLLDVGGGVYISVGALVLIIVLLIILL